MGRGEESFKFKAPKKFQRPKLQTPGYRSKRPWKRGLGEELGGQ